jgi:hypothetical protein
MLTRGPGFDLALAHSVLHEKHLQPLLPGHSKLDVLPPELEPLAAWVMQNKTRS